MKETKRRSIVYLGTNLFAPRSYSPRCLSSRMAKEKAKKTAGNLLIQFIYVHYLPFAVQVCSWNSVPTSSPDFAHTFLFWALGSFSSSLASDRRTLSPPHSHVANDLCMRAAHTDTRVLRPDILRLRMQCSGPERTVSKGDASNRLNGELDETRKRTPLSMRSGARTNTSAIGLRADFYLSLAPNINISISRARSTVGVVFTFMCILSKQVPAQPPLQQIFFDWQTFFTAQLASTERSSLGLHEP